MPAWHNEPVNRKVTDFTPSSEWKYVNQWPGTKVDKYYNQKRNFKLFLAKIIFWNNIFRPYSVSDTALLSITLFFNITSWCKCIYFYMLLKNILFSFVTCSYVGVFMLIIVCPLTLNLYY